MGDNPSFSKDCGYDCPVERISWDDCQEFIRRLNQMEGTDKYRLPTEAEWEYACRAGSTTAFANGGIKSAGRGYDPNLDQMGWYSGNSGKKTHPVGRKKPNLWDLFDMHGNVREWCQDRYGKYRLFSATDPKGPFLGSKRVCRGGSWKSPAQYCRSATRYFVPPAQGFSDLGLRLVRESD